MKIGPNSIRAWTFYHGSLSCAYARTDRREADKEVRRMRKAWGHNWRMSVLEIVPPEGYRIVVEKIPDLPDGERATTPTPKA